MICKHDNLIDECPECGTIAVQSRIIALEKQLAEEQKKNAALWRIIHKFMSKGCDMVPQAPPSLTRPFLDICDQAASTFESQNAQVKYEPPPDLIEVIVKLRARIATLEKQLLSSEARR